jgi:hypothetical protein
VNPAAGKAARIGDAESDQSALDYSTQPELALLALVSMLSRFAFVRCPRMAASIQAHFLHVARDERLPPLFRETAARLHDEWRLRLAEPIAAAGASLPH